MRSAFAKIANALNKFEIFRKPYFLTANLYIFASKPLGMRSLY